MTNQTPELFPVPGLDNYYVSKCARVFCDRKTTRNRTGELREVAQTSSNGYGHLFVGVNQDGRKRQSLLVHRIMAIVFIPKGNDEHDVVRHLDGNPQNNSIENLAWGTHAENQNDRNLHGTSNKGSANGRAKHNEDQVKEIRRRVAFGETRGSVARSMGISRSSVSLIVSRKQWKDV